MTYTTKKKAGKRGPTIVGDLRRAAAILANDARLIFDSLTAPGGRWLNERDKAEFDELNRLSKRLREIARAFKAEK